MADSLFLDDSAKPDCVVGPGYWGLASAVPVSIAMWLALFSLARLLPSF